MGTYKKIFKPNNEVGISTDESKERWMKKNAMKWKKEGRFDLLNKEAMNFDVQVVER